MEKKKIKLFYIINLIIFLIYINNNKKKIF